MIGFNLYPEEYNALLETYKFDKKTSWDWRLNLTVKGGLNAAPFELNSKITTHLKLRLKGKTIDFYKFLGWAGASGVFEYPTGKLKTGNHVYALPNILTIQTIFKEYLKMMRRDKVIIWTVVFIKYFVLVKGYVIYSPTLLPVTPSFITAMRVEKVRNFSFVEHATLHSGPLLITQGKEKLYNFKYKPETGGHAIYNLRGVHNSSVCRRLEELSQEQKDQILNVGLYKYENLKT